MKVGATMLARISISSKIIISMLLFTGLIAIIVSTSLHSLKKVSNTTQSMADDDALSLFLAASANEKLTRAHQLTYESVTSNTASDIEGQIKEADREFAEYDLIMKQLDPMIIRSQATFDKAMDAMRDYRAAVQDIRALAVANKDAEAGDSLDGAATSAYDRCDEALGKLIQDQRDDLAASAATSLSLYESLFYQLVIGSMLGAASIFGLVLWIIRSQITTPIAGITKTMGVLASGNVDVSVEGAERRDEIGSMAVAVQVFKDNAIERIRLEAQQAVEREAKERRAGAVEKLIGAFDGQMASILRTVSSAATELDSTAQSMAATAEETSRQATASAGAAEQTSANVQTVASAAEEMTGSLLEISRQVSRSTGIANDAVNQAEQTDTTVQGLAEAAQKINDVVELISTIAGQTNLLALNATIEAARAGEHGKGFAVVASEVKNLASQTAKATQDITAQIASIQEETNGAVTAIQSIGGTIRQMNEITTTIAAAVEEQNAATAEISRNVAQAAAGTREVSLNVGQVMEASAQTGSAATQVLGAAGELSQQAEMLRAEVERFLAGIRAA
jgi:methyl-accepting chemotaxis protein